MELLECLMLKWNCEKRSFEEIALSLIRAQSVWINQHNLRITSWPLHWLNASIFLEVSAGLAWLTVLWFPLMSLNFFLTVWILDCSRGRSENMIQVGLRSLLIGLYIWFYLWARQLLIFYSLIWAKMFAHCFCITSHADPLLSYPCSI